jgi:hypothetical protein
VSDPKEVLGVKYSSGDGYAAIDKELRDDGLLPKVDGGGSCGIGGGPGNQRQLSRLTPVIGKGVAELVDEGTAELDIGLVVHRLPLAGVVQVALEAAPE